MKTFCWIKYHHQIQLLLLAAAATASLGLRDRHTATAFSLKAAFLQAESIKTRHSAKNKIR